MREKDMNLNNFYSIKRARTKILVTITFVLMLIGIVLLTNFNPYTSLLTLYWSIVCFVSAAALGIFIYFDGMR